MIHIISLVKIWKLLERLRSVNALGRRRPPSWRIAPHVKSLEHVDGVILFDTWRGRVLSCNRTSSVIWQRLQKSCEEPDVARWLASQYDLDADRARRDVTVILAAMARRGLIRRTGNGRMNTFRVYLVAAAWLSLALYDVARLITGFRGTMRMLGEQPELADAPDSRNVAAIITAVRLASRFYCGRVWCLQRSAAIVRMLRRRGIRCELVIGFRVAPFFGHAWVEIDGQVIGDSAAYRDRLKILYRA